MRYRKTAAVCVIAACIAIGIAFVLSWRLPNGVAVVAPASPVDVGAENKQAQTPVPVIPKAPPPTPIVQAAPQSAPPSRREFLQQRAPIAAVQDRYRSRQYCPADFNRDDTVDGADLAAYVESWQLGDQASDRRADVNRDRVVDGTDMTEFLNAYFNNDCNTQQMKDRREAVRVDRARGTLLRERMGPRRTIDVRQPSVDSP
ncbi:MAG: GC-type dockerin domain-anchored protein [Phycisphaerales bacterium]